MSKFYIPRFWRNRRGFTALEIVVSLGIFLLILLPVMDFVHNIVTSQQVMSLSLTAQKEARAALEKFVKETRNASASSIGAYMISQASSTSFIFYSDIDNDTFRERVRYFISGTNFNKGVIKPAGNPLVYNVGSEVIITMVYDLVTGQQPFTYYDETYNGANNALVQPVNIMDVRLVKVKLNIDQKSNRSPEPLNVETQVEVRNLKYAE